MPLNKENKSAGLPTSRVTCKALQNLRFLFYMQHLQICARYIQNVKKIISTHAENIHTILYFPICSLFKIQ